MVKRCDMLTAIPFFRLLPYAPLLVGLSLPLLVSGCASSLSRRPTRPLGSAPIPAHPQTQQLGIASWYGPGFHGQSTASGEVYNQNALTAAHRTSRGSAGSGLSLCLRMARGDAILLPTHRRGVLQEGQGR